LSFLFTTVKQSLKQIKSRPFFPPSMIYCTKTSKEETKTDKQKAYIAGHPVSIFAPPISGLHTFGRKQRFLRFSTMHHGMYGSI
jgi:hypothetical protein